MKNNIPSLLLSVICSFSLFSLLSLFSLPGNGEATVKTKNVGDNNKTVHHAPDFEVTASKVKGALEIKATAPALHHFNLQAPMVVTRSGTSFSVTPSQARDQIVFFNIKDISTATYEVLLYLCDDAKTFCEKHKILAQWNGTQLQAQAHGTTPTRHPNHPNRANAPNPSTQPFASVDHVGFILNRPEEALREAHQKKKPLMIDFFGIWCPPCNNLDEVVFSSPEFKEQSAGFVKLKLDADSSESWNLKSKYKIMGYPTVIFASPEGKEISRIVGFRNEQLFLDYLKNTVNYLKNPGSDPALSPGPLLEQDPTRTRLTQLSDKTSHTLQETRAMIQLAKKILTQPESKTADDELTHADLLILIADSYDELGENDNAQEAWIQAADEYRKKIKSGKERGFNLDLAHCLWKAGRFEAAEKIYQKFENLYPKEFTFYLNHATMKMEQKKWSETEDLARKALEFSYGDNKLRATYLLAKTLRAQDRQLEAKKLIDHVLNSFPVPEDPKIRTHRYIKQLRDLTIPYPAPKPAP